MSRYALFAPDNRLARTEAFSYWAFSSITVADSVSQVAPDGSNTAKKIMADSSVGNHFLSRGVPSSGYLIGERLWWEFYWFPGELGGSLNQLWENAGRPLISFHVSSGGLAANADIGYLHTWQVTSFGWYRAVLVSSLTPRFAGNGNLDYYHYLMTGAAVSSFQVNSGDGGYFWHPRVGPFEAPYITTSDSQLIGDCVMLEPSWDALLGRQRFIEETRTSSGRRSVYPWGDKQRIELPVEHLRGRDGLRINSWWANADSLYLKNVDSLFSASVAVFLGGNNPPLAPMKVYDAEWSGVIKLEEY